MRHRKPPPPPESDEDGATPAAPFGGPGNLERVLWLCLVLLSSAITFTLASKRGANAGPHSDSLPLAASGSASAMAMEADQFVFPTVPSTGEREGTGAGAGQMMMKWQTPVYRVNIASVRGDSAGFNRNLSALVLEQFLKFEKAGKKKVSNTGWKPNGVNQLFFEWQTNGGWKSRFEHEPVVAELTQFLQLGTDTFLRTIGQSEHEVKARGRAIHAWATVHRGGIHHMSHTHPDHMVSGVYYVAVPPQAGGIIFSDPRGRFPPFDETLTITPKAGDLILFPSWLTHEVAPTTGTTPRISIAFNTEGDWASTTGVSAEFPMELDI